MKTSAFGKTKNKPKNFFRYFLNEFILLRRDFYFELDREPDEIAWQLRMLNRNYQGLFTDQYRLSTDMTRNEDVLEVSLLDEFFDSSRQRHYELSRAKTFIYKREDEKTIVEGDVRMTGGREWFFFILYSIFSAMFLVAVFQGYKDISMVIVINLI